MRKQSNLVIVVLIAGLLLAACAPGAATVDTMMEQATVEMMEKTPTDTMMEEKPTDSMLDESSTETAMEGKASEEMMEKTGAPEMMEETATHSTPDTMMEKTPLPVTGNDMPGSGMKEDGMMSPDWFTVELIDEGTGEMFMIEDFKGKVVLVETFAQWCPTCLRQQREIVKLHEMMGMNDDLVSVSLDVDPNEDAAMLQAYLEKHGFDWRFAIASPETAREIGSLYGQQFLNPPSAPVLVIDRQGAVHPLPFGVKSAEDLQEALKPFLEAGM